MVSLLGVIRRSSIRVTFETDLERLRRFYESRGYLRYRSDPMTCSPDSENKLLAVRFDIRESAPVLISAIDVEFRLHREG